MGFRSGCWADGYLYLVGFKEGEAPEELALPRKMGI